MMTSSVCRVRSETLEAFLQDKGPGMHVIPEAVLQPRQVRINCITSKSFPATLRAHRGSWIVVLAQEVAERLVASGHANWEPQKALVYSMDEYLGDPDVFNNVEERVRATDARASGATTVLVAIVGESRSALAVCRNIASGCQKLDKLKTDAEGAVSAANVYLVE